MAEKKSMLEMKFLFDGNSKEYCTIVFAKLRKQLGFSLSMHLASNACRKDLQQTDICRETYKENGLSLVPKPLVEGPAYQRQDAQAEMCGRRLLHTTSVCVCP